jgi:hypothetical protein
MPLRFCPGPDVTGSGAMTLRAIRRYPEHVGHPHGAGQGVARQDGRQSAGAGWVSSDATPYECLTLADCGRSASARSGPKSGAGGVAVYAEASGPAAADHG